MMLLRRVIDHVRAQNWTAVALDFVIVVSGVFIGIQVANWNDARKAQIELEMALGNVAQNISDTIAHREDQIQWSQRIVKGLTLMIAALDREGLSESEWNDVYFAMSRAGPPPPAPDRYVALVCILGYVRI